MRLARLLVLLLLSAASVAAAPTSTPTPPAAARVPVPRTLHGETVIDEYAWLRDARSPRTRAYLRAEAAYADAMMKPTAALRRRLYAESLARTRQDDETPWYREGSFEYQRRTRKGHEHASYWRRRVPMTGFANNEVPYLDLDALARGHAFISLGMLVVSDDGRLAAYTLDTTGSEDYTLYVKDLQSGRLLPERIAHVTDAAFSRDGHTLLYTVTDSAKRAWRIYRHRLGDRGGDALVYQEDDARFAVDVQRSADRALLFIASNSHTTSEVRFVSADAPGQTPTLIAAREPDHLYDVDAGGGTLYIRTNRGDKRFHVVTAPVATPGPAAWRELVPARADVFIDRAVPFASFVALEEHEGGLPQLYVLDPVTRASRHIEVDEPAYHIALADTDEYTSPTLRFIYSSPTTPLTYYDFDRRTGARTLVKREEVPAYDPARYVTERVHAVAADGVAIPITILRRRDIALDGTAPLLLEAYGAYGEVEPVGFDETVFSLVDRGVVAATAHVRGGGELGQAWHDAGRLQAKRTTFTDFITCAEWLIANGYVTKGKLAIEGGSAGGLLIGAVLNLRPELFGAAVAEVPFVDVVNSMLDETMPLTVGEFEEWGNPKEAAAYTYMRGYCPYENVRKGAYPPLLVTSALHDARAGYWEAAKWVARLRACKTDDHPLLFKIDLGPGGHGGPSGRYQQLVEVAYVQAFLLTALGIGK